MPLMVDDDFGLQFPDWGELDLRVNYQATLTRNVCRTSVNDPLTELQELDHGASNTLTLSPDVCSSNCIRIDL